MPRSTELSCTRCPALEYARQRIAKITDTLARLGVDASLADSDPDIKELRKKIEGRLAYCQGGPTVDVADGQLFLTCGAGSRSDGLTDQYPI